MAVVVGDAVGEADGEPEADADPLGTGVAVGVGIGLGVGKSELGILTKESAKISTKRTITIATQILARLSVRGGSEPRYPGVGWSVIPLPSRKPPVRRPGEG